jgi:signal transduction histidine kinase
MRAPEAPSSPRFSKSLDKIVFVSFILVFSGMLAVGGASLLLVNRMMEKTYAIEKESHNLDFINQLHNKTYNLMLLIHRLMVDADEKHKRQANELSNGIDADIAHYLKHEMESPYPEGKEEMRLLLEMQKNMQRLRDSVAVINQLPGGGLITSEQLTRWDEVLDRHALLIWQINKLHFDIITRKVGKSSQSKTIILGLYLLCSTLGLVLVYLGYRLHSRRVVQPIKQLADFTSRISEGELKDRATTDSQTEIGQLYDALNAMLDRLQTHENFLAEFNQHLEDKVEERTLELMESQSQLLRYEKMAMLGQIAASVNHEIRTPLNALYMNLQLVKKAFDSCAGDCKGRQDITDRIAIIDQEVHRISDMLEEFVRYARLAPPQLEAIDLNQVVRYVADMLSERAEQSRIKLTLALAESLPTVLADENKLVQALVNLCINAFHAMPEGGTLKLATKHQGNSVEIDIADTGVGIPEEDISKIFLPFFTKKESGMGFGLSIVQRIVEGHNGQITCQSRVGDGTVFTVQLPVEQSRKTGASHDRLAADR